MPTNDTYEKQIQMRQRDDMEVNSRVSWFSTKVRKNKKCVYHGLKIDEVYRRSL